MIDDYRCDICTSVSVTDDVSNYAGVVYDAVYNADMGMDIRINSSDDVLF